MSSLEKDWRREGYSFDQDLSDEIRYRLNHKRPSHPFPKWALLIFLAPILAPLAGIPFYFGVAVALFLLFVVNISRIQKEGDALTVNCPKCCTQMSKTWIANIEYFKCPPCRVYALLRTRP